MENNWLNLIKVLKKSLISTEIVYHLQNKKKLMNLLKKYLLDNLIYKYKTERISSKDFRNYQTPIELFKNLKDSNIDPKEVLKDQISFKSDLDEIKKSK